MEPVTYSQPLEDTSGITRAYALMALGFPMVFIPMFGVPFLGALFLLWAMFSTFRMRKSIKDTVIVQNHVQWILRTFGMAFLYFILGFIAASAVIKANANTEDVEAMRQALTNQTASPDQVTLMMAQFHTKNATLIYWTQILCFAPCLLFFALRCIKGFSLAEKYRAIANVKTWLI